jgi:hypothetical protein
MSGVLCAALEFGSTSSGWGGSSATSSPSVRTVSVPAIRAAQSSILSGVHVEFRPTHASR